MRSKLSFRCSVRHGETRERRKTENPQRVQILRAGEMRRTKKQCRERRRVSLASKFEHFCGCRLVILSSATNLHFCSYGLKKERRSINLGCVSNTERGVHMSCLFRRFTNQSLRQFHLQFHCHICLARPTIDSLLSTDRFVLSFSPSWPLVTSSLASETENCYKIVQKSIEIACNSQSFF